MPGQSRAAGEAWTNLSAGGLQAALEILPVTVISSGTPLFEVASYVFAIDLARCCVQISDDRFQLTPRAESDFLPSSEGIQVTTALGR